MHDATSERGSEGARSGGAATHRPLDPAHLPGSRRAAPPRRPRPQLASPAPAVPPGDGWLHELKFDGYRILARRDAGGVRLYTRNGRDWTERFPELAADLARLPHDAWLVDGEAIAVAPDGTSSFALLQRALSGDATAPLVFQAFDLLHVGGHDLREVPLRARKDALRRLLEAGAPPDGRVRYTEHVDGLGATLLDHACRLGVEGVVSKRRDAPYRSGRQETWRKAKCVRHAEAIVGGFTEGGGSRVGFGALLLGLPRPDGTLAYAGKVGTGFDRAGLLDLRARLERDEVDASPFAAVPAAVRRARWVRPVHLVEVAFTEWTRDGLLRHAVFRGLREDKDPDEVRPPAPEARAGPDGAADPSPAATAGRGGSGRGAPGGGADGGARAGGPAAAPTGGGRGGGTRGGDRRPGPGEAEVAGVRLSSPDRVLYAEQGATKLDLARYYEDVADRILPGLRDRPLSLVRCPQGREEACFYQKHPGPALARELPRTTIEEKEGLDEYLYVRDLPDLIRLVQAGVLELHVWGSRVDDLERPDRLVFDLDPGPEVAWAEVPRVARELRDRLAELGLESLPRTTGGKGLHVVVPLAPSADWEAAKAFARAVAERHAADDPRRLTTNMAKAKRRGRIFLDYLRNDRGSTAIASYSTRARVGAPVAVPLRWDEVRASVRSDRYTLGNVRRRLAAQRDDPWASFDDARHPLTDALVRAVDAR